MDEHLGLQHVDYLTARYHGPACRQRARRARLAVDPDRAQLLALAQRAEHAALALRRAVTTGQDHDAAVAEWLAAADALAATLSDGAHDESTPVNGATTPQDSPVTKSVTETVPCPAAPEPAQHSTGSAQRSGNPATNQAARRRHTTQQQRPQPIDPDTVRLERSGDYDLTGTWHVVAGPANDPIPVGFVRRNDLGKRWQARTPALVAISGGPWRTRQDAVLHLVQHHQQATASRSRRRQPR
jgi:hypothetical protein